MEKEDKPWTTIIEEHLTNEQRSLLSLRRIEVLLTEIRDALLNPPREAVNPQHNVRVPSGQGKFKK